MPLRVMILIGGCVLVLGLMMLWITPATTSQPRVIKPVDSGILSHGTQSSAGLPGSHQDHPDTTDSREK
jgi:hypothetical protein